MYDEDDELLGTSKKRKRSPFSSQLWAIFVRKFFQLIRNWKMLTFELIVPTIQIFLFMVAMGPDPQNLELAVDKFFFSSFRL